MLIVVRHGRTEANASGLLLGRLDPPLDDEGRRQAGRVADLLGPVDEVISSPLARTRQTAAVIAGRAPVRVDDRWIELDYGEWDGTPARELPAETWQRWRSDLDLVPKGGESLRQLGTRVREACEELSEAARSRTVVVVSHVSPIKAAVSWALGVGDESVWRMFLGPGSITRIAMSDHGPVLWTFNEQPTPS